MKRLVLSLACLCLSLAVSSCGRDDDPCPVGLEPDWSGDRCVPIVADGGAPYCAADAAEAWEARWLREGVVELIDACDERCLSDISCTARCLAREAGLSECATCVERAFECGVFACRSACGNGTDAECRACQCDAACFDGFDACSGHASAAAICADAHGRDATEAEYDLPYPILYRRKSQTGFTRASFFRPGEMEEQPVVESYAAAGWTDLHTFTLDGVSYLLEFMGACGRTRCPARISPVLSDMSLGRPVWRDEWDLGWDVTTQLQLDGAHYFIQYKSGAIPIEGDPRGTFRMFRIAPGPERPELEVELIHRRLWTLPLEPAWTFLRGFESGGRPFLIRFRSDPEGDAAQHEMVSVDLVASPPAFRVVGRVPDDLEWTHVETLRGGDGVWLLLRHSNLARLTRVNALVMLDSGPALSPHLASPAWPGDVSALVSGLRLGEGLLVMRRADGTARIMGAGSRQQIVESGLPVLASMNWGRTPHWDATALLGASPWAMTTR
ncbi:MAG TPA: hypothetical protein DEF51_20700 [Myxococcales bacterium]|nr:hypothetical protein [Myxococcales bacterium]